MRVRIALPCIAIAFSLSVSAHAERYEAGGHDYSEVSFVDLNSIEKTGPVVSVGTFTGYAVPDNRFAPPASYLIPKIDFDCDKQTLSVTYLGAFESSGAVISSRQLADPPRPIIPKSINDIDAQIACQTATFQYPILDSLSAARQFAAKVLGRGG